jgi:prephenate dehydrogenase
MTKLAVIGPGLLGGSVALAARRAGGFHVSVWARRPEAAEEVRAAKFADHATTDLRAVAADADLAVLCVPVGAMPGLALDLARCLPEGAVVTDVGSVKRVVVHELSGIFGERRRFVGSHPMAGSEQTGLAAAQVDLFDDAVCIVTPGRHSKEEDVAEVSRFWETLGCRVRRLSPEAHDEIVALVSHFPHLLAALLVRCVEGQNTPAFDYAGPGFRDVTRVASGPPEMWAEILRANAGPVKKSAEAMIEKLREALTLLEPLPTGDDTRMFELLSQAKIRRDSLKLPE